MEIKGIRELLERYRQTLLKGETERSDIVSAIKDVTQLELNEKEFSYERSVVILKVSPIKKNHLFLYKERILEEFKRRGIAVSDIH